MRNVLFLLITIIFLQSVNAQTIDEIKRNRNTYLWGQGKGSTLKKADQEALAMLISQISTQVESSFTLLKNEMSQNGNSEHFKETFNSVINTYSNATLKNTERIVISNEPDAEVFRYIKRDEVKKVFAERKDKILGFTLDAENSLEKNQIADALRYYYWALTLLKSHPDGSKINYIDKTGQKHLLATWLPMQINNIFAGINIKIKNIEKEEKYTIFTLNIFYNNKPISNFDYSYWDGSDWSNLISGKNGIGLVELDGVARDTKIIKIKAEYIFEGEAIIDRELDDVLQKIDPIPFRNSYFTVPLIVDRETKEVSEPVKADINNAPLTEVQNKAPFEKSINNILESIKTKNYLSVQNEFTTNGYNVFKKLIQYGNAKVLENPKLKFIAFDNKVICRSVPMSFNFKTNNKQFIEDVVFHFDSIGKVETLTFGLSKIALNDIINNKAWKEYDRMILVNFLENYKTAYALKRLSYIESIFADDALIITGAFVKVKPNEINKYTSNRIVKFNRQTKQEYIKNLKYSFNSKEYVNIKFEDSKIRKAGKGGDIYGVQIKQNYYSSNYGDEGYLFLMVDLNNPNEPIIHVRTWQPVVNKSDSIYGLSDFF